MALLATEIIAISENVKSLLIEKEGAPEAKVRLVPHGFKLEEFDHIPGVTINQLKEKYQLEHQGPVIGVIARWLHLKGIQYIIPAFENLYGTLFFDKGNVFERRKQVSLADLRDAVGLGLKYKTPLGPIRVELGWNLDQIVEEKKFIGFITIGNVF